MTSLSPRGARRVVAAVAGAVLLPVLVGCAAPGTGPGATSAGDVVPAGGTAPGGVVAPGGIAAPGLPATSTAPAQADCVRKGTPATRPGPVAQPGGTAASGSSVPRQPPTDEQRRAEEFRRQQAANDGFRQRGTLGEEAASGARACAAQLRRSLNLLTAGGRDQPGQEAVRRTVEATGLTEITVRAPGRLDLGPAGGLVFAGWTGRACVFGSVRADAVVVEIGTRIADGGCLPAPN